VYAAFFAVQLSFNFDVSNRTNFAQRASLQQQKQGPVKATLTKANNTSKRVNIRLNKRFHPETFPSYAGTVQAPPVVYIDGTKPVHPKEYLLLSVILAQTLRGPPAVA